MIAVGKNVALILALILASSQVVFAAPLDEPITPLAKPAQHDPARVEIGRRLFNDPRMSSNNRISCASCHDLHAGGADRRAKSLGFDGRPTTVNTPTVFNSSLNFKQFWNGRAASLESQIHEVVQNPVEMGSQWGELVAKLQQDAGYRKAFAAAYKDGITHKNIQNAIASFERTLVTPDSRFDKYLRGDDSALTAEEKNGYAKFKQYGCIACHQGANVGGNMFQKFGVLGDYFASRGGSSPADLGRYSVTHRESDRHVFKVPSLRNVALTAPYFHDGSATTLEDAVDVMFKFQLGRVASGDDKKAIVLFLNTLTGQWQAQP